MQVALGFSICILVLIVHSSYSPYYDAIQNRVSQICMIELACILFVGLLFKMEILSNGSASSDILSYFVVLLCIMVMIDPLLYNALTFGLGNSQRQQSPLESLACACDDLCRTLRRMVAYRIHPITQNSTDLQFAQGLDSSTAQQANSTGDNVA